MDTQKNLKIIKANPKLAREFNILVHNYFYASAEHRNSKREALKKHILKRKQTDRSFDVNAHMGFEIKLEKKSGKISTLIQVVSQFDDEELFELLREQGLEERNESDLPLWYLLVCYGCNRSLEKLLLKCDFDKFFINNSWTPLHVCITFNNVAAIDLFCKHPKFDRKYLEYLEVINKVNPLTHAALYYNPSALQKLLDLKAPFLTLNSILAPVDFVLHKYIEVYATRCFSTYMRKKIGLEPVASNEIKMPKQVAKSKQHIIDTLYLLFNQLPHENNCYQIAPFQADNTLPKKYELFKNLEEYHSALNISSEALKLLLDILLSMGPGLYFSELPVALQKFYSSAPSNAQVVMPVIQKNGQTIYLYFISDVHSYFQENINSIQPIGALYQYAKSRLGKVSDSKISDDCLINLQSLIEKNYGSECIEEKIVKTLNGEVNEEKPLDQLKRIIKQLTMLESTNGFDMTIEYQLNVLSEIRRNVRNDEYFSNIQNNVSRLEYGIKKNAYLLPRIFSVLIRVNELYRGAQRNNFLQAQENFLWQSTDLFYDFSSKIDFYVLNALYYEFIVDEDTKKISVDFVFNLISAFKLLNKKNSYTDYQKYKSPYFRVHFLLEAMLLICYLEKNQPESAARQFKKLVHIFEAANDKMLFAQSYGSTVHHIFFTYIFARVIQFAAENLTVQELYEPLFHILQCNGKMLLPDNIYEYAFQCVRQCINQKLFYETEELLSLISKHEVSQHEGKVDELNTSNNNAIQAHLNKTFQLVLDSGLEELVDINSVRRVCQINLSQLELSENCIRKYLPEHFLLNRKIITIDQVHLCTFSEIEMLLDNVKEIIQLAQKNTKRITERKAQNIESDLALKLSGLSVSTPFVKQQEMHRVCFLMSYYSQQKSKPKNRVKKLKNQDIESNDSVETVPQLQLSQELCDRAKLKQFAKIDDGYGDLIMIICGNSGSDDLRFLAIKSEGFEIFTKACHQFENEKGEIAVSSINPYGENEHGVKLYDNGKPFTGEKITTKYSQEKYVLKIKGSTSDRAIGVGKEFEYNGKKIIIYLVDDILTHKKADRFLKTR